jgi:Cu+-exporting ATPase
LELIKEKLICFHCGDNCPDDPISYDNKAFCCSGCKTVYEILNQNNLCTYYSVESAPGISFKNFQNKRYEYLDDEKIINQILDFHDNRLAVVTFYIPQMHCSSCIWLLENLFKIDNGIKSSEVNFLKKELVIRFDPGKINLREVIQLLASIGYEPLINLESIEKKTENNQNKKLYYKIGIAAFCFGNIMLLTFPEYLSIDVSDEFLKKFFAYLIFVFSLPVFFYSSSDYFISAYKGIKKKIINLDFPLSLGIIALFGRSTYEVFINGNPGYFDSLAGLIFFLLIGKLFQNKTYDTINFERDYKSYFPLSVTIKKNNRETSIPVSNLSVGDRIIIRNGELIPADAILFNGSGNIDYSFVTGESSPVRKVSGELIYAGGKQRGEALELEVIKAVSQSYLTQLWNNDSFTKKDKSDFTTLSNIVSKYFTAVILLIALISGISWLPAGVGNAVNIFTAVLIIACPCALAMSTPFTLGNTLRIFGKNKFYIKNTLSIEQLAKVDVIVFDKTGTLTTTNNSEIKFVGKNPDEFETDLLKNLAKNSSHPLSRKIFDHLEEETVETVNASVSLINTGVNPDAAETKSIRENCISSFNEVPGEGIEGMISGNKIKLGSKSFVIKNEESESISSDNDYTTKVYLSINDELIGYFRFSNQYRNGIKELIQELKKNYSVSLLSGDNEGEKEKLKEFFNDDSNLYFNQSPQAKLDYIKSLKSSGEKVLMIGDGLNDAGALAQSNVGVAVTDNTSNFSPACDAVLHAQELSKIPSFLEFSRICTKIILISFAISFAYNAIGLSFAVAGFLSPLIAAVLMPLSSISVVVFATLSTNLIARKRGLLFR